MGSIESAENSEVKAYLQKILHNDPNAKNEWNEEQKTPRVNKEPYKPCFHYVASKKEMKSNYLSGRMNKMTKFNYLSF
jgi:hypothetical protein